MDNKTIQEHFNKIQIYTINVNNRLNNFEKDIKEINNKMDNFFRNTKLDNSEFNFLNNRINKLDSFIKSQICILELDLGENKCKFDDITQRLDDLEQIVNKNNVKFLNDNTLKIFNILSDHLKKIEYNNNLYNIINDYNNKFANLNKINANSKKDIDYIKKELYITLKKIDENFDKNSKKFDSIKYDNKVEINNINKKLSVLNYLKKEYIKTFEELKNYTWKNRTKIKSFEERYSERFFRERNNVFNKNDNNLKNDNKKRKITELTLFPEDGEIDVETGKDLDPDNVDLSNVKKISI